MDKRGWKKHKILPWIRKIEFKQQIYGRKSPGRDLYNKGSVMHTKQWWNLEIVHFPPGFTDDNMRWHFFISHSFLATLPHMTSVFPWLRTPSISGTYTMHGVFVGHSFVVSLQHHLRQGGPALPPTATAESMAISEKVDSLQFVGEWGAKVWDFNPPLKLTSRSFDFILLQLGANNGAAGPTPSSNATAIMAIAHLLIDKKVAKHVAICSLLPLSGNVHNMNYPTDMRQCNSLLYHVWGWDLHYILVSWGFQEGPGPGMASNPTLPWAATNTSSPFASVVSTDGNTAHQAVISCRPWRVFDVFVLSFPLSLKTIA